MTSFINIIYHWILDQESRVRSWYWNLHFSLIFLSPSLFTHISVCRSVYNKYLCVLIYVWLSSFSCSFFSSSCYFSSSSSFWFFFYFSYFSFFFWPFFSSFLFFFFPSSLFLFLFLFFFYFFLFLSFLVACTRLYKSLCRSVGRSVGRSVRRSVGHTLLFFRF